MYFLSSNTSFHKCSVLSTSGRFSNAVIELIFRKFPIDIVSLYLGMTTEAQDTADALTERNLGEQTDSPAQAETNPSTGFRPLSNLSASSGAIEESLAAYAERTLQSHGAVDANLDISFHDAPNNFGQETLNEGTSVKVSEMDKIDHGTLCNRARRMVNQWGNLE